MAHASDAPLLARQLPAGLNRLRDRIALELRYRRTLDELERLTDRDLADMGMHRASLAEIAWEEARRERPAPIAEPWPEAAPAPSRAFAPYPLR